MDPDVGMDPQFAFEQTSNRANLWWGGDDVNTISNVRTPFRLATAAPGLLAMPDAAPRRTEVALMRRLVHLLHLGECHAQCLLRPPTSTIDACPQNMRTNGNASGPGTLHKPRSIAVRDTRSNAPMPSTERTVVCGSASHIDCNACATHSHPARVGEGVLKRCGGGLHCF